MYILFYEICDGWAKYDYIKPIKFCEDKLISQDFNKII